MVANSMGNPHVVIVHGANCTPKHHHKIEAALQKEGFEVEVPWLPTASGTRPAIATFDDDVRLVHDLVSSLLDHNKEVLMLMHSYGGIVGSSAVKGLSRKERVAEGKAGGVTQLVYFSAYMLREGQNCLDIVSTFGFNDLLRQVIDFNADGTCLPNDPKTGLFAGLSPEDYQEQLDFMVPFASGGFEGRATYAAWKDIPSTYIYSTKDMWTPTVYQDLFLKQAEEDGVQVRVEKFDVAHAMQAEDPQGIVRVVESVVSA